MGATTAKKKPTPKKSARQVEIKSILDRVEGRIKNELATDWRFTKLLTHAGEHPENIFVVMEMALGDDEDRFAELMDNNTEKMFKAISPFMQKKST